MTSVVTQRLRVGVVGLGRLGYRYARDIASRIPETRLVAVSDLRPDAVARAGDEFDVTGRYLDAAELVADPSVDAVVLVTSSGAHRDPAILCARAGKPTFCEKPPALTLSDAIDMREAVEASGSYFQLGFMRRFDSGYIQARQRLLAGTIGRAVLFKSTSRDPAPPSLEYADRSNSGGMILDLGIHDFDLARFFVGEVEVVSAVGDALAHPELRTVGDIDTAVVSLRFTNGALGVIDLSRNAVYGYDVRTEILGEQGALRVGSLDQTPLQILTAGQVAHDTVPGFMERFSAAYTAQLRDFARNVLAARPTPVSIHDGVEALRVALAVRRSLKSGHPVEVASVSAEDAD